MGIGPSAMSEREQVSRRVHAWGSHLCSQVPSRPVPCPLQRCAWGLGWAGLGWAEVPPPRHLTHAGAVAPRGPTRPPGSAPSSVSSASSPSMYRWMDGDGWIDHCVLPFGWISSQFFGPPWMDEMLSASSSCFLLGFRVRFRVLVADVDFETLFVVPCSFYSFGMT